MKCVINRAIISSLSILFLGLCQQALCQQLKIKEQNGHVSPVRATITFQNGRSREVIISAIGDSGSFPSYYTHAFFVRTDGGAAKRTIWIDTIASIKGLDGYRTSRSEFTIVLKSGTELEVQFVGVGLGNGCQDGLELNDQRAACSMLQIGTQDEGTD
jgi:hypothetical protein